MEVSRLDISKDEKNELKKAFSKRLSTTLGRSAHDPHDVSQKERSPLVHAFEVQLNSIIGQKSDSEYGSMKSGTKSPLKQYMYSYKLPWPIPVL